MTAIKGCPIKVIAFALLSMSGSALAVQPITDLPLQVDAEQRWHLPAGEYRGSFSVDQPMHIVCAPGAVFQALGQGNGVIVSAPDVSIEGCTFLDWGHDLTAMNSAVFLQPKARGAVIRGNRMQGQGFGIWVDSTRDVSLIDNRIQGDPQMRSQDRGNGIHLYAVRGARVIGNHVRDARDGIYIDTSNGNLLQGNTLEDLRYGVHYMFANDNQVLDNITRRTRTGYALMQSRKLTVTGNRSEQDQNYGILMNYITYSTLRDNFVTDVRDGSTGDTMIAGAEGKALFIYNSLFNSIEHNHFERSAVGIHLTAGSEDNRIADNAFIGNQRQVKYVATRLQEWSRDGRGNYWSDYLGWDRNNDGLGDIAYEPNDNVDRLLWLYPQVRLLMNSPGIELLRWVQRAFPVMKSPGVMDSHPLMKPTTENLTKEPIG
ncbi:nitrous oxide reductase family maturation protein NosD [Pseudomonas fluorescens]|uniref:nitrous oxide reductase family maturation protein NosD n=1 Tax=Pseudomonas fluorescens TaxID=294 RepID=UPI0019149D09|nr:nitrous oxide reductase family maturation protein NosD [Pseudomonas fluorescens]